MKITKYLIIIITNDVINDVIIVYSLSRKSLQIKSIILDNGEWIYCTLCLLYYYKQEQIKNLFLHIILKLCNYKAS